MCAFYLRKAAYKYSVRIGTAGEQSPGNANQRRRCMWMATTEFDIEQVKAFSSQRMKRAREFLWRDRIEWDQVFELRGKTKAELWFGNRILLLKQVQQWQRFFFNFVNIKDHAGIVGVVMWSLHYT